MRSGRVNQLQKVEIMDTLTEYEYLWNRQSGWQLTAFYVRQWEVIVMFADDLSFAKKMGAVRKLGTSHSLQNLKAALENSQKFNLGIFPVHEVQKLRKRAAELELTLQVIDRSMTQYLPIQPKTQLALLLDTPDDITQQIIQNMLDAGVPIVYDTEID
jgi:hypothetical protein